MYIPWWNGFSLKTVRLLTPNFAGKGFYLGITPPSRDFTYSKNKEKESFSPASWDVQMSPGSQSLGLWVLLSPHIMSLGSLPKNWAEFVGRETVDQPYRFLIPPIPWAQPSLLLHDTEHRYNKAGEEFKITNQAKNTPQSLCFWHTKDNTNRGTAVWFLFISSLH